MSPQRQEACASSSYNVAQFNAWCQTANFQVGQASIRVVMTLATNKFIRRFLLHNLPRGFHRIRDYGLIAGNRRKDHLERARQLLAVAPPAADDATIEPPEVRPPCSCCGGRMIVIEILQRRYQPRAPPASPASAGRQSS